MGLSPPPFYRRVPLRSRRAGPSALRAGACPRAPGCLALAAAEADPLPRSVLPGSTRAAGKSGGSLPGNRGVNVEVVSFPGAVPHNLPLPRVDTRETRRRPAAWQDAGSPGGVAAEKRRPGPRGRRFHAIWRLWRRREVRGSHEAFTRPGKVAVKRLNGHPGLCLRVGGARDFLTAGP